MKIIKENNNGVEKILKCIKKDFPFTSSEQLENMCYALFYCKYSVCVCVLNRLWGAI